LPTIHAAPNSVKPLVSLPIEDLFGLRQCGYRRDACPESMTAAEDSDTGVRRSLEN
jgi:hypothetical protein